MQVTSHTRTRLRLQTLWFVLLFMAVVSLIGWLSTRYHVQADWTASGRNSLSPVSEALLDRLPDPVQVTFYIAETNLLQPVETLLARYQRYKPDMTLSIVNPQKDPRAAREKGITSDGELFISYQGRMEQLKYQQIHEHDITNALQRLVRGGDRYLVFVEGHGERNPLGEANFDLLAWGKQLQGKGLKVQPVNLTSNPIPDNTAVLVIASPQVDYLPGEVKKVLDFVKKGGNLLWLGEPPGTRSDDPQATGKTPMLGLGPVADFLGVGFMKGTIVDMSAAEMLGADAALYALGADYGRHPISENLSLITLYPEATAIEVEAAPGWQVDDFLRTNPDSWLETGRLDGEVVFDAERDRRGPLTLGVALARHIGADGETLGVDADAGSDDPDVGPGNSQRVVIMGDGDFLSNTFGGNGGNLEMGSNIINWLSNDDSLIDIPIRLASDTRLQFSQRGIAILGLTFLFGLPLLFLSIGGFVWWRRRRA
jgi:ABC-type uncharacterized transport system involved in gliding motility auxiliary subunit